LGTLAFAQSKLASCSPATPKMRKRRSAPASQRARARARDSEENVALAARKGIPRGNAREARKEESQREQETVTKEKVKDGVGEKTFGKSMGKNLKEIGGGTRRRTSQAAPSQLQRRK
jgi:hypothetical protein